MSISDRLDQISARAETVVGLTLGDDNARDAYNLVEDAVPDLVAALRAVLDLCELIEKAHAANPKQTYEQGMEVAAHKVRTVIAAALGEDCLPAPHVRE